MRRTKEPLRPVQPTTEYIQGRFNQYNEQFFNGSLPPIPIRLSHAKGFLGKVSFVRKRKGLFSRYENTDFVLRINVRIDLPQEIVDDTILHEMIHYYIAYNQWTDTSTHGRLFRREMERINGEGNRHITISHRLTETEQAQASMHKGRVVAVVTFADGRTGVKVVPKQIRHILAWDKQARKTFAPSDKSRKTKDNLPISDITWYYTDDGYFAKYPSSTALRIYLVDAPQSLPLAHAHRLSLADGKVRMTVNPDNNLRW